MTKRQKKIAGLIKKLSAELLERIREKNLIITVTDSTVSPDLKRATILITTFPEEKEEAALNLIRENVRELQQFLGKKMHTKFLPKMEVQIDKGEKTRQLIEKLSEYS